MTPRKSTARKTTSRRKPIRTSGRSQRVWLLLPLFLLALLMVDVVRYRTTGKAWLTPLHKALEGDKEQRPEPQELVDALRSLSPQDYQLQVNAERTTVSISSQAPDYFQERLQSWPHEVSRSGGRITFGYPDLPGSKTMAATPGKKSVKPGAAKPLNKPVPSPPPAAENAPTEYLHPDPQPSSAVKEPWPRPVKEPQQPSLAIVIDDVGQSLDLVPAFLDLNSPMTYAVIPFLPESVSAADLIHARGMPVILHLPMEPLNFPENDPGSGAILTSLSKREVQKRARKAMEAIPHLEGFNNHMGSKATASPEVMQWVMAAAKKKNLYFLDSRTNAATVGFVEARKAGLPTLQRDTFLDDTDDVEAVKVQLQKAADRAKREGFSVAIGHIKPNTLEALRQTLPELKNQGIRLVTLTELMGR